MSSKMPAAEVEIDVALVDALLAEQHPDLAGSELAVVANGWDNVMLRLGDDLAVRVPRRAMAAPLVEHEIRCLPALAPRLPIAVPVPWRVGRPSEALGYPWAWSVVPWFDGDLAAEVDLSSSDEAAVQLGEFVAALHAEAPGGDDIAAPPVNPFRGHFVGENDRPLRERLDTIDPVRLGGLGVEEVVARWEALTDVEPWPGPPVWLHGDLHPLNLLVAEGRFVGVIDFGDVCAGDPATDLAVAWALFDPERRQRFRHAAGDVDDATWQRAEAWSLHFSVAYLRNSDDHPGIRRLGERLLDVLFE